MSEPFRQRKLNQRIALLSLVTSYIIMVGIVIGTAFWTQREFDKAAKDRCDLLAIDYANSVFEISIMGTETVQFPIPEESKALLKQIEIAIKETCPEVSLDAYTNGN